MPFSWVFTVSSRKDASREVDKEFKKQCQLKDEECKAAFSKQLLEVEEKWKKEIFEKEEYCKTLASDKRNLESVVLQLKSEIQKISAELDATYISWKLEKYEHSSEIEAVRKETEEITKSMQMAEQAWKTEKEKSLSSLAAYEKKIEEMAMETERVLILSRAEKIELECRLNKSRARTQELLEDKHLWTSEKGNLDNNVAELQRKLDMMATEKALLSQRNSKISTEVESLKAQLNEHNARVTHLEDETEKNERVLHQCRTQNIDLQLELNESNKRIQDLVRKNEQERRLWDDERKYLEATLAGLNEFEQEDMDGMRCLQQQQNQRVEELETSLHSFTKVLESRQRQSLEGRSLVLENGKTNIRHESIDVKPNHPHEFRCGKPNRVLGMTKPKPNGAIDRQTPNKKLVNGRAIRSLEMRTPPTLVAERSTPSKFVPEKQTSKRVPAKRSPIVVH